jgi:hypothetical protein
MAFDAQVGIFLEEEPYRIEYAERLLEEINRTLLAAGQEPHQDPRSWEEVFARHPSKKKKKKRDLGARLGFYSSEKYGSLSDLLDYLEHHRASPGRWPLTEPSLLDDPRWFLHTRAMLSMGTAILPRALPDVLYGEGAGEVLQIVSAPRLQEECQLILAACGAYDSGDPNEDWKSEQYDEALARWGITKRPIADVWTSAGEPLDLCLRLIRVADDVIWSGAFGITN